MKCYKLTKENGKTHGGCRWGPGVTHTAPGNGDLCSEAYIHGYENKLVAVFMNPVHGRFARPRMWEAEAEGEIKRDGQLKFGCTKMTTIREIPIPEMTTEQRVRIAILCAKQVCFNQKWNRWADAWLSGKDRSAESATAAERSVMEAAMEAGEAAASQAAEVSASASAWAAWAAEDAARSAEAAYRSERTIPQVGPSLDLVSIIESVVDGSA